jgi:hypothetical protein
VGDTGTGVTEALTLGDCDIVAEPDWLGDGDPDDEGL